MRRAAALAVVLLLAACASDPQVRVIQSISAACAGYATALTDLAAYRAAGRLSEAQVAAVDRVRTVVTPLCTTDPADPQSALASIEQQLLVLVATKKEIE